MADNRINISIVGKNELSGPAREARRDIDGIGQSATGAAQRTSAFGSISSAAFGAVKIATAAAATGFVAATGLAIAAAADYEQSLNVFQSVSNATADQMKAVGVQAKALGQDITLPGISAKDAAFAMVELSKAGLSVNDTLKASKGVLALARAGQLDTAEAASIAANALNAFNLEGSEAGRVADLLAAGANASSADVRDMAFSLQMSAAQAAAVKVPVEDLTTAIAEMANNGVKGSDAGTSLKTMFMNLIPTTDKAKDSMRALNLDFYDAQGRFVGMRSLVEQLQKGTRGLTDEQKALHIENIFGADSSRAVNILLKEGVQGYDKLRAAVTKTGAATSLAAAQNSGFKGALDNLQSSLETVAIDVGTRLLPKLTTLIQTVGPRLTSALSGAANGLVDLTDGVPKLLNYLTSTTGILPGLAAGFVAYQVVVNASTVATAALAAAQTALNVVMSMNPFALAAAAAVGIVVAYMNVINNTNNATNSSDRLRLANDALRTATDNNKAAQDRLNGALLSQEGASLGVERAQRAYTDAVAQYGPKSLEAREAEYNLKRARDDLANATASVRDRTNEARDAANKLADAKDRVVAANKAMENSARGGAAGFLAMADAARKATEQATKGNTAAANQTIINSLKTPLAPGARHASGTPYAPGGLTLVGERGPELVNLPRGSQVAQAWKTREMASQDVGGGGVNINFHGPVDMGSRENVDYLVQRVVSSLDALQRQASYGMAA